MAWIKSGRVEECESCGKPFLVTGGGGGPFQDREDIDCPYCGKTWGREKTSGMYYTHKLTPEQEEEYRTRK